MHWRHIQLSHPCREVVLFLEVQTNYLGPCFEERSIILLPYFRGSTIRGFTASQGTASQGTAAATNLVTMCNKQKGLVWLTKVLLQNILILGQWSITDRVWVCSHMRLWRRGGTISGGMLRNRSLRSSPTCLLLSWSSCASRGCCEAQWVLHWDSRKSTTCLTHSQP